MAGLESWATELWCTDQVMLRGFQSRALHAGKADMGARWNIKFQMLVCLAHNPLTYTE